MRGKKRGGVVLLVEVEERGTIVINELYPSTSAATTFWGGVDVSETNFLGRGVNLGGGFVGLDHAQGARRARRRRRCACTGRCRSIPSLGVEPLGHRALQRRQRVLPGRPAPTPTPTPPTSSRSARAAPAASWAPASRSAATCACSPTCAKRRSTASCRRRATSIFPSGLVKPIDFDVDEGNSRVGSLTLTLDYDTRPDPVLPRSGGADRRLVRGCARRARLDLRLRQGGRAGVGLHAPAARPRAGLPLPGRRARRRRALLRSLLRRRPEPAAAAARAGHQLLDAGLAQPARHRHRRPPLRRLRGAHADRVRHPDLAPPRLRLRRRRVRGRRACSAWPARATSRRPATSGGTTCPST